MTDTQYSGPDQPRLTYEKVRFRETYLREQGYSIVPTRAKLMQMLAKERPDLFGPQGESLHETNARAGSPQSARRGDAISMHVHRVHLMHTFPAVSRKDSISNEPTKFGLGK